MESEMKRLGSFKTWNFQLSNELNPSRLARIGFYFEEPNIRCINCAFALSAIDTGDMDTLVHRHRNASPDCSLEIDNVSVNSSLPSPCDLVKRFEASSSNSAYSTESETLEIDIIDPVATVHPNLDVHDTKDLIKILNNSFQRAQYHGVFGNDYATVRKDRKNPDYAALQNERTRLRTFHDWPANVPAKPDVLAKAGFFYTDEFDIVQCAFCKKCIGGWTAEDVPIEEHRKYSPDCSFVTFQVTRSLETCSVNVTAQRQPPAAPSRANVRWNHSAPPPRHPHMADESKRVESFTGKIVPRGQNVTNLAYAGFYYVGPQDQVKCFYCDGGLEKWQPSDEPWCEHARWFPDCKYLQARRGDDFIREIQEKHRQTQTSPLQRNLTQGLSRTNQRIGNNNDSAVTRHIESREVKVRMDMAAVQAVTDMGYSRQLVIQVIQKKHVETGDNFPNIESLAEAVIEEKERLDRASEQGLLPQNNGVSLSNTSENRLPTKRAPASFQQHDVSAVTRHIEPLSVEARMDTAAVQAVIARGYSRPLIKQVIQKQLETGGDFSNDKSLADAVIEEHQKRLDRANERWRLLQSIDPQVLKEENRKLIEDKICQICCTAERNIVFLNCGHIVCCRTCAAQFQICPMCRDTIVGTITAKTR